MQSCRDKLQTGIGNFIVDNEHVFPSWIIVMATCCVKLVKICHCILQMDNLHLKKFSDHWLWRNKQMFLAFA